jgi:hypothetical protein
VATVTSDEATRINRVARSIHVKRYHFDDIYINDINNNIDVTVNVLLPVKTIIAIPYKSELYFDLNGTVRSNDLEINLITNDIVMNKMCDSLSYNLFCDNINQNHCINFVSDITTKFIPTGSYINKNKTTKLRLRISSKQINYVVIVYTCIDELQIEKDDIQFGGVLVKKNHNGNIYPLTKVSDCEFIEGYWFPLDENVKERDYIEPMYPMPLPMPLQTIRTDVKYKLFLDKLNELTKNTAECINYFGSSTCRICKKVNGSAEYKLTSGNITFRYPEGLIHYYEDHDVYPSEEFHDFVMNYQL